MPHKDPADRREYERRWRAANPEKVQAKAKTWRERHPEKHRENGVRWRQQNPEKHRARDLRWKRANPEKARAIVRRTQQNHPEYVERRNRKRRNRLASVDFDGHTRAEVFERDGGVCRICFVTLDRKHWHEDHVVPISRGGPDVLANVQATCPTCNMRKGDRIA